MNDNFVRDIVISFTLADRDTTSAPLTWIFWLLFRNPEAETPILNEIREKSDARVRRHQRHGLHPRITL